ncbi:MAG: DUF1778 domain-containing protein [Mucilaginibacter sp.]
MSPGQQNNKLPEAETAYRQEIIIASEKDKEVFFNALNNPSGPAKKLLAAADLYKRFMEENK